MNVILVVVLLLQTTLSEKAPTSESGRSPWIDYDTPASRRSISSSRGETWTLVMSDEFTNPRRSFGPGKDHLWTALELPDGVNNALEYYSSNMTSIARDGDRSVLELRTQEDEISFEYFNAYATPPAMETKTMYYRSGMIQSWNKFCFQGGRVEIAAKLPGAISKASENPDRMAPKARVKALDFYPTWPGVWLMGNLGRALFSASTTRMWPWSFNTCSEDLTLRNSQRISACNGNPQHGLNPFQGRGAPEIDIIEGGGSDISASIQVSPGFPPEYRRFPPEKDWNSGCFYSQSCKTRGANVPNVPTEYYTSRRPKWRSWYQNLRYSAHELCSSERELAQDYHKIHNAVTNITDNSCNPQNCPASYDVSGDMRRMDNSEDKYWNINHNGTCMAQLNGYTGVFLCDRYNRHPRCSPPTTRAPPGDMTKPFAYQMDAISANYPVNLQAYTEYLRYQLEWIPGEDGYIRWEINEMVLFEIPSQSLATATPAKIMVEEPMYFIMNVALSSTWLVKPPNIGRACKGDGQNKHHNRICDDFPLVLRIDYIRVYQNLENEKMQVGCDPASHPTRQYIDDHIQDYQDFRNPVVFVPGGAACNADADCTLSKSKLPSVDSYPTGECSASTNQCVCRDPSAWTGPRCTFGKGSRHFPGQQPAAPATKKKRTVGPPLSMVAIMAGLSLGLTLVVFYYVKDDRARYPSKAVKLQ